MVRTKVFVGNLSFKTKDNGLSTAFEKAGKVISATIVTRGRRSLGYGFVEFENEEGANKAVQLLNKKPLDEREINVELAKPRTENPSGGKPEGNQARPHRQQFRPRGPPGRNNYAYPPQGQFRPRRFNNNYNQGGGYRPRYPNKRRPYPPRKTQEKKTPSQTGLFVTNLPFKFTDEDFAKVFEDHGVKPKSAKVVRNRNNRSKGYGFVEFENNQDQQKALQEVNEKTVAERTLIVKVAMIEGPEQGQQAQQGQQAPQAQQAPKNAAPAPGATPQPQQTQTKPAQSPQTQKQEAKTGSPATAKKEDSKKTEAKKPAEVKKSN